MKDLRGSHVSSVRGAISRTFGLQLTAANRRRNSRDVLDWKKSEDVKDSYNQLFTENGAVIEDITNMAFPSSNTLSEAEYNDLYIYTAAVCDILLNPDNPTIEVSRKSLETRMQIFRVFFDKIQI